MRIVEIIWSPAVVDKLAWKHDVEPYEVEEVRKAFILSARDMDDAERRRL